LYGYGGILAAIPVVASAAAAAADDECTAPAEHLAQNSPPETDVRQLVRPAGVFLGLGPAQEPDTVARAGGWVAGRRSPRCDMKHRERPTAFSRPTRSLSAN